VSTFGALVETLPLEGLFEPSCFAPVGGAIEPKVYLFELHGWLCYELWSLVFICWQIKWERGGELFISLVIEPGVCIFFALAKILWVPELLPLHDVVLLLHAIVGPAFEID